jgi:hypothetical protein
MTKKLQPLEVHHFAYYAVVLETIKNDNNGNKRFKATIIDCGENCMPNSRAEATVYTFTGHCMTNRQEAEWILQLYLDESQN